MDVGRKMTDLVYSFLICSVYLFLALSGMTLIKFGHGSVNGINIPLLGVVSFQLMLGMFLYGASFLIFVFFISKMKIGIVVPIVSGMHCVLTASIGFFIFKERISFLQIIGVVMIAIGTVMIGIFKK